jgi:hypothetical protein
MAMLLPAAACAQAYNPGPLEMMGNGYWRVAASPYSLHWRPSEEHRSVWALGLEWQRQDRWLGGFARFNNSFGQPSAYAYVGKRFPELWGTPQLFGQLSAGVLYGYRGKFEDKVPLNSNGWSPGALATLGWKFNQQLSVAAHVLGDAGVMFQLSLDLR